MSAQSTYMHTFDSYILQKAYLLYGVVVSTGVISLTVARRRETSQPPIQPAAAEGHHRRNSVSSLVTSSDEDAVREYNVSGSGAFKMPPAAASAVTSSLSGTRNPVVDRLMGKDGSSTAVLPSNLRNESYYIATQDVSFRPRATPGKCLISIFDLVEHVRIQHCADCCVGDFGNHEIGYQQGSTGRISEEDSVRSSTNTLNNQGSDTTRESLTSLDKPSSFARDQPGRQSMSEKRHATLDAKNTDTYQKRKKAREDRDKQQRAEQQQRMWKKSASLESLHLQVTTFSTFMKTELH